MEGSLSSLNLAELICRMRQGDDAARDRLLVKYRPYLRVLAWQRLPRFIRKRSDGSDVVQQTLIDAVRGLPEFRGQTEGEFTAWMLRLLERNLLQFARADTAEKRDIRREAPDRGGGSSAQLVWHSLGVEHGAPADIVFQGEVAFHLAQALEQLPEEQRRAVEMRYLGQLPLQQISQEMDRSVSSVAGLIRRGVQALQAHLPTELGELT